MFIRLWLCQKSNRLIEIDLSRQIELDADPKSIQQKEFVGQLKNADGINTDGADLNDFRKN